FLDIALADLTDQVVVQTGALPAMARAEGAQVTGVKPHGALYNALAHHEGQAAAVVRALQELGGPPSVAAPGAAVVGPARGARPRTRWAGRASCPHPAPPWSRPPGRPASGCASRPSPTAPASRTARSRPAHSGGRCSPIRRRWPTGRCRSRLPAGCARPTAAG